MSVCRVAKQSREQSLLWREAVPEETRKRPLRIKEAAGVRHKGA